MTFSLAEAVNQVIAGLVTVASVFVGGWLAFRYGMRQLRTERAIDRRLAWQEQLRETITEMHSLASVLMSELEKIQTSERAPLLEPVRREISKQGQELQSRLKMARLYGGPEERSLVDTLFKTQLELRLLAHRPIEDVAEIELRLNSVRDQIAMLAVCEDATERIIRAELAMEPVKRWAGLELGTRRGA